MIKVKYVNDFYTLINIDTEKTIISHIKEVIPNYQYCVFRQSHMFYFERDYSIHLLSKTRLCNKKLLENINTPYAIVTLPFYC